MITQNLPSSPLARPNSAYYKSPYNKRDKTLTTASPSREFAFALHDVARMLRTYSDHRAREVHMTRAQWAVLSKLRRSEGLKQCELADMLDLAPITLARLVDKLTAAGLVERRDDASDRRINRLYLTDKAAPKLAKLGALSESIMLKALNGLDDESVSALRQGLERIKSNLKSELNSGV